MEPITSRSAIAVLHDKMKALQGLGVGEAASRKNSNSDAVVIYSVSQNKKPMGSMFLGKINKVDIYAALSNGFGKRIKGILPGHAVKPPSGRNLLSINQNLKHVVIEVK